MRINQLKIWKLKEEIKELEKENEELINECAKEAMKKGYY